MVSNPIDTSVIKPLHIWFREHLRKRVRKSLRARSGHFLQESAFEKKIKHYLKKVVERGLVLRRVLSKYVNMLPKIKKEFIKHASKKIYSSA